MDRVHCQTVTETLPLSDMTLDHMWSLVASELFFEVCLYWPEGGGCEGLPSIFALQTNLGVTDYTFNHLSPPQNRRGCTKNVPLVDCP